MISTHVLDISRGRPAAGVPVTLERLGTGDPVPLGCATTDADGRARSLLADGAVIQPGIYRLTFETGAYLRSSGGDGFYPSVAVVFEVRQADQHYHLPLLLSPFGYTTYRGS